MSRHVCIKCGGTGITFEGKKCECGSEVNIKDEISDVEKYIPVIYRNSEGVGTRQVLTSLNHITLDNIIGRIVKGDMSQSLIIDISETHEGAYNVYYRILQGIIENNQNKLPNNIREQFLINEIALDILDKHESRVANGDWKPLYLITDFRLSKYENLNNYLKILKFGRFVDNAYPLNIYHMKFKDN